MEVKPVVAKLYVAFGGDETETVEICVRRIGTETHHEFEVFADGGYLSNGDACARASTFAAAMAIASREAQYAYRGH